MNYNHLYYFQVLARHEHYGKASEELHITQPSLSKAIRRLETDLGIPLFEKNGRGVRLTIHGKRYLEYVNNAFRELQTGEDTLLYERAMADSFLKIGVVLSVASHEFPEWITRFKDTQKKHTFFSCRNGTSDALALSLKSGDLDLIVCSTLDDPKIEFCPLLERQLVLLTPPGHRLSSRTSVDIHELNGEAFIAHSRGTAMHGILADIYRREHVSVTIVSEADEDRAISGMVKAGLGCGVTRDNPELHGRGVSVVPITGSSFNRQISIGRRRGVALPPAAEAFWQFLVD